MYSVKDIQAYLHLTDVVPSSISVPDHAIDCDTPFLLDVVQSDYDSIIDMFYPPSKSGFCTGNIVPSVGKDVPVEVREVIEKTVLSSLPQITGLPDDIADLLPYYSKERIGEDKYVFINNLYRQATKSVDED